MTEADNLVRYIIYALDGEDIVYGGTYPLCEDSFYRGNSLVLYSSINGLIETVQDIVYDFFTSYHPLDRIIISVNNSIKVLNRKDNSTLNISIDPAIKTWKEVYIDNYSYCVCDQYDMINMVFDNYWKNQYLYPSPEARVLIAYAVQNNIITAEDISYNEEEFEINDLILKFITNDMTNSSYSTITSWNSSKDKYISEIKSFLNENYDCLYGGTYHYKQTSGNNIRVLVKDTLYSKCCEDIYNYIEDTNVSFIKSFKCDRNRFVVYFEDTKEFVQITICGVSDLAEFKAEVDYPKFLVLEELLSPIFGRILLEQYDTDRDEFLFLLHTLKSNKIDTKYLRSLLQFDWDDENFVYKGISLYCARLGQYMSGIDISTIENILTYIK